MKLNPSIAAIDFRKARRLAALMEPMSAAKLAAILADANVAWAEIRDGAPRFATSVWGRWEASVKLADDIGPVRVVLALIERPRAGEIRWFIECPGIPVGYPFKQDVPPPATLTHGVERAKWPPLVVDYAAKAPPTALH
ncbi:MAG: hypothetical protein IBJ15_00205 [Alphaproteobacteria bacterium]|nr:hypothetical protein [Alphaproteobacteria bacterium]